MTTVFIAGDSTAAHKASNKRPETGWGEKLYEYFIDDITVNNFAFNGASTKTFLKKGLLTDIDNEIKENDYLIIQFGHNDQKVEDPNWGTSIKEYQQNLDKFVQVARKHNATPIILSSIVRRRYDNNDKLINTLGDYPSAAERYSKENDVLYLDINKVTFNYIAKMSPKESLKLWLNVDKSNNYPEGIHDNTHLNEYGAHIIAGLIANEISRLNIPLSQKIININ